LTNTKKSIFYLAYLILSSVALILCIEGLGRLAIHMRHGIPGKSYGLWKYDPELGAVHRPNAYNTRTSLNNYGFRNQEDVYDPKPVNSLRIIAFGGSTTFGYNLTDSETYTEKLELKLRQIPGYEKTQVLNAGSICYSAGHNFILMKRLVPLLRPDYAILYEGVNEPMNAWALRKDGVLPDKLEDTYGIIGKSFDQNRWLKRNSVIVRFVDYYVKSRLPSFQPNAVAQSHQIHPWVLENYKYLLRHMIDFLKEQNSTPVILRYASLGQPEQEIFSNVSAEIAKEKGVLVCDMASRFRERDGKAKDLFSDTGVHVTPEGAEILADELFQMILQDLKNRNPSR